MGEETPGEQLSHWITAYWISQAIYVAAKLGLADELTGGARTVPDLARTTGAHSDHLYRLLRALASKGIFAEREDGRFELTPLAEPLREDAPASRRALAIMMGEEHFRVWGELLYSVRTGETAFDHVYGQALFDFLADHPEKAAIFDRAMGGIHIGETEALLDAAELSDVDTLVDVGGGNGSVLQNALRRYPELQGVLFDLPGVVERAREEMERDGLGRRCELVPGNFFEAVPEGGDLYLLRHIIHDWDDERSRTILANVRAALPETGRVLVAECVLPRGNTESFAKWLDLTMMVLPGGRERTEAEYRDLFRAAGLELTRVVPTASEIHLIEGRKA